MQTRWLLVLGALITGLFFGCGDGEEVDSATFFDSDVPGFDGPGAGGGISMDSGASGGSGGSATGGSGGGGGAGGAEKAIEEADIIQLQGTRLYALSKYGGLSVIDVSVKDQLKLLGSYKLSGEPFEMYVKDGVALAMYSSWGHYEGSGAYWEWVQSSAIVALDVKDPTKIVKLGEFLLPGEISDSRIVGTVLYAVSYENGSCWKCAVGERTNVISLDVKVPSKVVKVDEMAFGYSGSYGWGKRSVMVTQNRMFIGGRDDSGADGSMIQIVDISDPTGKLVKGASVPAAGSIESRWQMDEKDGVLRLISQPGWWSAGNPPVVQTFQVVSSQEIKPLASLPMVLPEPERLRSVRFDGNRGYAITFRQTDPLFVIDLSDPTAPKQVGELQMPGWVYHMEPRGDRLLALGFDQAKPEGALNVSLFDVADATNPKLLDRVDFGGDWGQFAEDQDRIHKAFTILDTLGLIFVPFSGWTNSGNGYYGCSSWTSGIQIVNFTKDDLVKRGTAPARGTARRAFLHDTRLFAVSDVAVETFDISDQDKPLAKTNLGLANVVTKVIAVGDKVARLGSDWYTSRSVLDVVPLSAIDKPTSNAVDLEGALGTAEESKCWYGYWGASNIELFANGSKLYVVAGYDERRIAVFDLSSGAPVLEGKASIPALGSGSPYGYGYYSGSNVIPDAGEATVRVGSALVALRRMTEWKPGGQSYDTKVSLDVVDLSSPKSPKHVNVALPKLLGATGLSLAGGDALFSHWAPSPTSPGKVRFYVDRLDLANPSAPKLSSTNVPGSLLAANTAGTRALTVTYVKVVEKTDSQSCFEKWGNSAEFKYDETGNWESGICTGYHRGLTLVQLGGAAATVLDSMSLPDTFQPSQIELGTDRVFMGTYSNMYSPGAGAPRVAVLSGFSAGKIDFADIAVPMSATYSYLDTLIADGTRAVVLSGYPRTVMVVDAKNAAAPTLTQVAKLDQELTYYGGHEPTVIGDTLVVPLGPNGVNLVDLTP
ncbi:MAG: hypothetical protein AMXMBFR56_49120 [Polyangiaceae bacterium]